jgi:hypothetical protein
MEREDYGAFIKNEFKKRRDMKVRFLRLGLVFTLLMFFAFPALSSEDGNKEEDYIDLRIPVSSELFSRIPLAIINGEEITLEDLKSAAAPSHEEMFEETKKQKIDYPKILKRLINVRLIVEEGMRIGLDELPEVKSLVEKYAKATLRDFFIDELGKDVKATDEEIENLYKEVSKEWKVKSLLFDKEEDAQRFLEDVKAGKDFDEILQKALDDKLAKGSKEGRYLKTEDINPLIKDALSKMEIGSVSPIIKVGAEGKEGYTIFKLEDIRFPEDPKKRQKAKEAILASKRIDAVKEFKKVAYKKYVKINKKLLDSIDFESKRFDLKRLLNDKRALVNIKGEKPVTVSQFVDAMRMKFFHGLERAAEGKKVNKRKVEVLEELIDKTIFRKEAIKRGLDKSESYKRAVKEYEESVIFGFFAERVIIPDIKISEEDIKKYYDENISEFTYPEMIKIDKIVFKDKKNAELAVEKLNKGADFKWVKANVEGQVSVDTEGLLPFQGKFLIRKDLSEDITKALTNVKIGEARLYESPEGYQYVLYILDIVPSSLQPLEEVREMIRKKLYRERLNNSIEEWAKKLKESSDVKVFLSGLEE